MSCHTTRSVSFHVPLPTFVGLYLQLQPYVERRVKRSMGQDQSPTALVLSIEE
jgi:hypothetical protein